MKFSSFLRYLVQVFALAVLVVTLASPAFAGANNPKADPVPARSAAPKGDAKAGSSKGDDDAAPAGTEGGGDAKKPAAKDKKGPAGDDPSKPPAFVKVGLWLLNIGQYNLTTGGFIADFYLDLTSISCPGADPSHPEAIKLADCTASDDDMGTVSLEFTNGRAAATSIIVKGSDPDVGGKENMYRFQAALTANVDLRRYPLDTHELPILLEDTKRTLQGDSETRGLVLVAERPAILAENTIGADAKNIGAQPPASAAPKGGAAPDAPTPAVTDPSTTGYSAKDVSIVGWELQGMGLAAIGAHSYPYLSDRTKAPETYARYTFTLMLGRLKGIASVKTFMPIFCFMAVLIVSLLIVVEKLDSRVTMNLGVLTASVMFHLATANSLPPLGYLTIADRVLMATYTTIGLNLILTVTMLRLMQSKKEMAARKLRQRCFFVVPSYAIIAYLCAFLLPTGGSGVVQ